MLRRKNFSPFEQFYMTDTDKKLYCVLIFIFSIVLFSSTALQRKRKKKCPYNMQQTKLQLNMPSLESSRKKVQLWGKPRELQEMSLVIQPFPGNKYSPIP